MIYRMHQMVYQMHQIQLSNFETNGLPYGWITIPLQWLHRCCFDKNGSWYTSSAHDFAQFVLLSALRGLLLQALLLNWIHSSAATFGITGLIKLAKIEFLPLDWIYRSIRVGAMKHLERCLHHCGGPVKLVEACLWCDIAVLSTVRVLLSVYNSCLCAEMTWKRHFHHRGGAVKQVQACCSSHKDQESCFHLSGGTVKLEQVFFFFFFSMKVYA